MQKMAGLEDERKRGKAEKGYGGVKIELYCDQGT
jgi:hypothetical protein